MALRLLFTLALAHRAVALLDGYVVKVTKVEHIQLASNLFPDVVGAAIDEEDGLRACATADAVINSCYSAGALETDAPTAEFENCMCCQSNTPISSAYADCGEYISSSISGSDASTVLEGRLCQLVALTTSDTSILRFAQLFPYSGEYAPAQGRVFVLAGSRPKRGPLL